MSEPIAAKKGTMTSGRTPDSSAKPWSLLKLAVHNNHGQAADPQLLALYPGALSYQSAMAGTRSSARVAASKGGNSSPNASQNKPASAGSKRKADGAPGTASKSKRGKKANSKEQITIEASMHAEGAQEKPEDVEMNDDETKPAEAINGQDASGASGTKVEAEGTEPGTETKDGEIHTEANTAGDDAFQEKEGQANPNSVDEPKEEQHKNGLDTIMENASGGGKAHEKNVTEEGTGSKVSEADNAVEDSSKREETTPSSILEKGIIYFFFRGRVGINEPNEVNEIARSYIVLRPIPHGAKIGDGPIGDTNNVRMLALPKKVLPISPKDRFLVFVEKAEASMEDVKQQLSSSNYTTKTAGARHTPAATPIGEGVYAITRTGRETHLAYILTVPSELSEVQQGVGLRQRGSYITSAKNPKSSSPANASLPHGAEYPQE